jgi:hypothetical protein
MKFKTLITTILLFVFFSSTAQINIGSLEKPTLRSGGGEIKKPDFKKLKRNTLVFFYGEKDKAHLDAYKKAAEAWTFGKVQFDDIANKDTYAKKRGFSFVTLETEPVIEINNNLGTKTEVGCEMYYHFWTPKGKDRNTFARIDLFTKHEFVSKLVKQKSPEKKVALMYNEGIAYNWGPGFMKLYFRHMSEVLNAATTEGLKEDFEDEEGLKILEKSVLFYPEYVLTTQDPKTKTIASQTEEELFEDYPFEHEMMLTEDFDNLLMEDEQGGDYVLIYTQCGAQKHYNIYNTNGQLLFHEHEVKSYNLDDGDLKKIAKLLK